MMKTSVEIYWLEDLDLFFFFQNGSACDIQVKFSFVFLGSFALDEGLF